MNLSASLVRSWACIAFLLIAATADAASPFYVLVTIDVETTSKAGPQQSIWGRLPGRSDEHGIGRFMDILDEHKVKGTFFANVYETAPGGDPFMREVCQTIARRGHDVELHTHPAPVFGVYGMSQADLATQVRILNYGAKQIEEWTGCRPVAHRAGAYAANLDTIRACSKTGIDADFSCNAGWPGCELAGASLTCNAPVAHDGIFLVPVTCYMQAGLGGWRSLRFLDVEASSQAELRKVISDLRREGVRAAVIMAHSFSFCRNGVVNRFAEDNLEKTLDWLAHEVDVQVVTARQLHDIWLADPARLNGADVLPYTGWWMTYCRAWSRLDDGWVNPTVAVTPPALAGAIVLLWWQRKRTVRVSVPKVA